MNSEPQQRMHRWIGGALTATLAVTATLAACSGGETKPSQLPAASGPGSDAARPAPSSDTSSAPTDADAAAAAPDAGIDPATDLRARAQAARRCDEPRSALLNLPDGGVVFNNAMTSVDAGFIDRTQPVLDVITAQHHAIRCCFDAARGDGSEAKAMLVLALAADGQVDSATIDPRRSSALPELVSSCLSELFRAQSYPPSPTGKVTVVEYRLTAQQPK